MESLSLHSVINRQTNKEKSKQTIRKTSILLLMIIIIAVVDLQNYYQTTFTSSEVYTMRYQNYISQYIYTVTSSKGTKIGSTPTINIMIQNRHFATKK